MKTLCYILSISLFLLAGLPCTDTWATPAHEEASPSANECLHSDEQAEDDCSEDDTDTCSPLCPCACIGCHGFSINVPLSCPLPAHEYILFRSPEFLVSQYQGYLAAIWQPPQQFL